MSIVILKNHYTIYHKKNNFYFQKPKKIQKYFIALGCCFYSSNFFKNPN
jgi:hypothetical protein